MQRTTPTIPTILKMQNSIFSKIKPTVLSQPDQSTQTPIPPYREMRLPTNHNIDTHVSDVRVQDLTRLRTPVIPKSISNHLTPPPPSPPPYHTLEKPLRLGLPPQSYHAKLLNSPVDLGTHPTTTSSKRNLSLLYKKIQPCYQPHCK